MSHISINTIELSGPAVAELKHHPRRAALWKAPQVLIKLLDSPGAPENADALAASVRACGVQTPIIITEEGLIVDGARRVEAYLAAGLETPLPVRVISEGEVGAVLLNAMTQVRSFTKFQRLFTVFPLVRDAYRALLDLAAESRGKGLKLGATFPVASPCSDGKPSDDVECVKHIKGIALEGFNGADGRPLRAESVTDLENILNTRTGYLSYCEGIYNVLDALTDDQREEGKLWAHRYVFADGENGDLYRVRVSAIASAIAGHFNGKKVDDADKPGLALRKRVAALGTVLERWQDPILYAPENRPQVESALESFAASAWKCPEFAEILAEKLVREGKAMKAAAGRLTA